MHFELDVDKSDYLLDLLDDVAESLQDPELNKILQSLKDQAEAQ